MSMNLKNEKFKFARSMLYNGRCPGIKDVIGFHQRSNVKLNAPKKLSNFVKGKAPMVQDSECYILYPVNYPEHKIRRMHARKPHTISHTRAPKLVFGYPRCLFLTSKDPRLFGYLRTRPKLFCRFMHPGVQVG
jgi:hypothetical protein